MNLEMQQKFSLRERLEALLDALIEKIIDIGDYAVCHDIEWLEIGLFLFSIFRAVWFIVFGVENANYSYYFSDKVWTTAFTMMTVTHIVGFFMKSKCFRVVAGYMYAFVWGILMMLAIISLTAAPAVPSLLPLLILSIVVIVRLSEKHKKEFDA